MTTRLSDTIQSVLLGNGLKGFRGVGMMLLAYQLQERATMNQCDVCTRMPNYIAQM